jgi:hypothetical protein
LCQIDGVPDNSLPRDELRATVEARRDLGSDYESALIESFIEKIDNVIDARVRAEVAAQSGYRGAQSGPGKNKGSDPTIGIALGSLGIGIPLTAIAADQAGPAGLFLAWTGIVLVNIAAAFGRRRR